LIKKISKSVNKKNKKYERSGDRRVLALPNASLIPKLRRVLIRIVTCTNRNYISILRVNMQDECYIKTTSLAHRNIRVLQKYLAPEIRKHGSKISTSPSKQIVIAHIPRFQKRLQ
jgi:hypothetical protein